MDLLALSSPDFVSYDSNRRGATLRTLALLDLSLLAGKVIPQSTTGRDEHDSCLPREGLKESASFLDRGGLVRLTPRVALSRSADSRVTMVRTGPTLPSGATGLGLSAETSVRCLNADLNGFMVVYSDGRWSCSGKAEKSGGGVT